MELQFGDYCLDPAEGLSRGTHRLHVTPKSLSVLHVLVGHPGKVIGKEQLIREVWNGIAVSDSALTSCIKELRRALDDDAKRPRFIETLNRRGFRFIATVTTARASSNSHELPSPIVSPGLFVGRDEPLSRLGDLVQRALTGHRQVIFVAGEPGIGKTALVDTFGRSITRQGTWRLTHGQCVEHYGESEPYQPLLDAIARLCHDDDRERFVAPLRQCAPSWLAQLPSLQAPEEVRVLERRTAGVTPQRMRRELVDALDAMTVRAPIALWLEDVHWSDLATLDWIADFAARREPARVVLIATCRTAEVRDGHPLRAMVDSLHVKGWCEEIVLRGLTEADVCRLFDIRFPGGGAAAERLGRMVNQHTDGNPLFVMNVIGDLIARGVVAINEGRWAVDGDLDAASLGVPDNVRRTITRQIDRLTPRERGLLEVMAVLGGPCAAAALATGAGLSTTEVETTLGSLAREHWLIGDAGDSKWPDGTQSAAFEFLHALYREVVGARLHAAGRVELHRRIGERLEQAYATNLDEIAAELAVHFEEARDVARAVAYLQRAAETSRRRSAYAVAEAQLRRALALLEQLPISPRRAERETKIRMALGSLLMAVRGWGSDEIETHYDRALALCRELGPTRHLFPSLWGLWLFQWGRGDARKADELATRLRGQIDGADSARVLQAYHAGWATSFLRGHLDDARGHAAAGSGLYRVEQHASLASAYGNHDAGTCAMNFWARAAVLSGAVDEAVRQSDASLALARELGHPFTLTLTLFFASTIQHARQDAEATRAHASAGAIIANEHGFSLIAAWSSILEGWSLVQIGRQGRGLSLLRDGLSAAAAGSGVFLTYFLAVFAEAQFACSHATEALRAVDEGLRLADRTGERFYESELYRLRGELTLRTGGSSAIPAAERDFLRACTVSREQNARWLFLRAATSVAGVAHGTVDGRVQLLTEALAGISEGLGLPDVRIARELLDRLNAEGRQQVS